MLFEKSNATNLKSKAKGFFLLIVEKISKSKKTKKESDILHLFVILLEHRNLVVFVFEGNCVILGHSK